VSPEGTGPEPAGGPVDEERIGPFSTWGRLYATVIVYGVLVILLLALFTFILSPGTGS
jgi:hypothetical protein